MSSFKLQLPNYPTLGFASLRGAYAVYGADRCTSKIGTIDNITFNSKESGREPALILRTLLHELVHLWQQYHGKPSRGNYHNAEFRAKALACGLIVSPRGCTSGHTQVFTAVLAKHGIRLDPLVPPREETRVYGARGERRDGLRFLARRERRCVPEESSEDRKAGVAFALTTPPRGGARGCPRAPSQADLNTPE